MRTMTKLEGEEPMTLTKAQKEKVAAIISGALHTYQTERQAAHGTDEKKFQFYEDRISEAEELLTIFKSKAKIDVEDEEEEDEEEEDEEGQG